MEVCDCPEVLIVDDNVFNIHALRTRLSKYNLRMDQATSGWEAIEKVKEYEVNYICNMDYGCR